jgi:hypothetical protein
MRHVKANHGVAKTLLEAGGAVVTHDPQRWMQ